jgi:hypothetical protein
MQLVYRGIRYESVSAISAPAEIVGRYRGATFKTQYHFSVLDTRLCIPLQYRGVRYSLALRYQPL